jgi:hypothetical protein
MNYSISLKKLLASIQNIFVDMDNTVAIFSNGSGDDQRVLPLTSQKGFYLNLLPMPGIEIYQLLYSVVLYNS